MTGGDGKTLGPIEHGDAVQAWTDEYIPFGARHPWQKHLRGEIRSCCRRLEPSADQVLHASFFGPKLINADVENVLLYNIDESFKVPGRNGIRFELGPVATPQAPDRVEYRHCYRYELAPRLEGFRHWREGRTLASFDWIDLGSFVDEKRLAQVWLAVSRSETTACEPFRSETPFALRVEVRPPRGRKPGWGGLVKGVFDGVICAFQRQTDPSLADEAARRLAAVIPADPAEIKRHLFDPHCAALGTVQRLVSPHRNGVKWNPSDHLCLAGELLAAEPVDGRWAIKGELVELWR